MRPPCKFSRPLATIALFLATTNAFAQAPAIGTISPAQATVNAGVSQTVGMYRLVCAQRATGPERPDYRGRQRRLLVSGVMERRDPVSHSA